MKKFLVALQFLTSMPVKIKSEISDKDLAGSMAYFPLVGLLIGAILALAYNIFILIFPLAVACAFLMALNVMITGGLHIDGFIDTFDSIACGGDRKKMLDIMREGRPGAVGLAAAILLFLAKYSLLVSLPKGTAEVSLISMAVLSRGSFVFSSALYPYARDTDGLGGKFARKLTGNAIVIAAGTLLAIVSIIFRSRVFILIPIVCCVMLLFNSYFLKKIGGITGDTLGALGEIIEVLTLALAVVLI